MKNINLFTIILISIGTFAYAGGEFIPIVTPYEKEDITSAIEAEEETIAVVEEPIKEEPVIVKPKIVPPIKVESKEINPSGFYAGLGISGTRYRTNCDCKISSGEDKNIGIIGRVGYDFNRYIGIEVRGMKTIAKEDGAKITHSGLFVKPMVPLFGMINLYALLGASKTSSSGELQNVSAEGLSMGAGWEIDLSRDSAKEGKYSRNFDGEGDQEKGIGLFFDYERLVIKSNAPDIDTFSTGITYDF